MTPGIGYLESLKDPKTTVAYGEIAKISPNGCVTDDGKEYPVDVLVCAVSAGILGGVIAMLTLSSDRLRYHI